MSKRAKQRRPPALRDLPPAVPCTVCAEPVFLVAADRPFHDECRPDVPRVDPARAGRQRASHLRLRIAWAVAGHPNGITRAELARYLGHGERHLLGGILARLGADGAILGGPAGYQPSAALVAALAEERQRNQAGLPIRPNTAGGPGRPVGALRPKTSGDDQDAANGPHRPTSARTAPIPAPPTTGDRP